MNRAHRPTGDVPKLNPNLARTRSVGAVRPMIPATVAGMLSVVLPEAAEQPVLEG